MAASPFRQGFEDGLKESRAVALRSLFFLLAVAGLVVGSLVIEDDSNPLIAPTTPAGLEQTRQMTGAEKGGR